MIQKSAPIVKWGRRIRPCGRRNTGNAAVNDYPSGCFAASSPDKGSQGCAAARKTAVNGGRPHGASPTDANEPSVDRVGTGVPDGPIGIRQGQSPCPTEADKPSIDLVGPDALIGPENRQLPTTPQAASQPAPLTRGAKMRRSPENSGQRREATWGLPYGCKRTFGRPCRARRPRRPASAAPRKKSPNSPLTKLVGDCRLKAWLVITDQGKEALYGDPETVRKRLSVHDRHLGA